MDDPPTLRLASLAHLRHPMSVDLHIEQCATKSKLVIARVLGGTGYWRYGVEQYAAHLHAARVPLALLPGDDKEDPDLRRLSTVGDADYDALWSYLVEGGPGNSTNFLAYAIWMLRPDGATPPEPARPLLKAGLYWPGAGITDLDAVRREWTAGAPVVPIVFYRALLQGAGLNPINRLVRSLLKQNQNPLPIFVASLKDPVSAATVDELFRAAPPAAVLNCTAFAVGSPHDGAASQNPLNSAASNKSPVFQVVLSGSSEAAWLTGLSGLSARDIAMNVALPEVDGRILSRAISFKGEAFFDEAAQCPIAAYRAVGDRVDFVARLAANWTALRRRDPKDRRIALILANYPNRDGRLANGVGLDTPASTVNCLNLLAQNGYHVTDPPADSAELMRQIMAGPTNWLTDRHCRSGGVEMSMADYQIDYGQLPYEVRQRIEDRWGPPEGDPFHSPGAVDCGHFALSILQYGNVVVGLQPARGYNIDPTETYHSPDLVPPHHYLAFYFWLRHQFRADAILHMGKHGNLEWLPGKSLALSETCLPEVILGPTPHIYPFIVNDPGEGTQAKRRAQAVIIDHLTPPLTRAETYGPLRDLEALVDEYYEAAGVDPRRITHLRREILSLTAATGLDQDAGFSGDADTDLAKLDAYLCELKEAQIRDGLHIFGASPQGDLERDLTLALARAPRGDGKGPNASLLRALADDLGLSLDPLDCDMAAPAAEKPALLEDLTTDPWRSNGDTVERLELHAQRLLRDGGRGDVALGPRASAVLREIETSIRPAVAACGPVRGNRLSYRAQRRFRPARPLRRPHARTPRRAADRAQLLLGRQPRRADADRLVAGLEIRQPADRKTPPGPRRLAPRDAADRLGHRQHAHRRRRHRAVPGPDGRQAAMGQRQPPRHRVRGHPRRPPSAGPASTSRCASRASSATPSRS